MKQYLPTSSIGYAALGLLGISMIIHLLGGLTELFAIMTNSGTLGYAILMLIGFTLPIVVIGATVSGVIQPRATYATLSGLMVLYIVAYADVHAMGYLETITGADLHTHDHNGHDHHHDHNHDHNHDHHHEESTLETIGDHLVDDPIAVICKISEGTAAVLFALLAVREE